jgi:hypothetical protein
MGGEHERIWGGKCITGNVTLPYIPTFTVATHRDKESERGQWDGCYVDRHTHTPRVQY